MKAVELLKQLEGQHYNTKVRNLECKGSRQIRLGVQESKKMIANMMNPKHSSPNPADDRSESLLKEASQLLGACVERIKEVKDSKKRKK